MKGAIADPPDNTMSTPKMSSTTMIGNNQNFLRTLKKPHKSFKNSITV